MKKEQIIVAVMVALLALAVAFFGRTNSAPEDATVRIQAALKARVVPVVVVTAGRDRAAEDTLRGVRRAIAGQKRVRFIHIDMLNPVERDNVAQFPKDKLPLILVIGLDGHPAYTGGARVEPEAIKAAVAEGLTKPPVRIEEPEEGHNH